MGVRLEQAEEGNIGLIMGEKGRIVQLGIPAEENTVIQVFLATLSSKEKPFVRLDKEHDLIEKWKFDEVMEQLSKVIQVVNDIKQTLFDPNHEIANYHLNGDLEPIQNFIDEYDLDSVILAEEILSRYEPKKIKFRVTEYFTGDFGDLGKFHSYIFAETKEDAKLELLKNPLITEKHLSFFDLTPITDEK